MRKILYLGILAGLLGCAGNEADIERAKYLVGRGGIANANSALNILTPMLADTSITGSEKFELIKLYAGAKMSAAGFDSIKLISALVFTDDDKILKAVRSAGVNITNDSFTLLTDAETTLNAFIATAGFDGGTVREQSQTYFQISLVKFLQGMRIFLKVSGFAAEDEATFDVTACQSTFGASNLITNPDAPVYGLGQMTDSRAMMINAEQAKLSAENDLPVNLQSMIDELTPIIDDAQEVCNYLETNI